MLGAMGQMGNSLLGMNGNSQMCQADYKMDCMSSPEGDKESFSKSYLNNTTNFDFDCFIDSFSV